MTNTALQRRVNQALLNDEYTRIKAGNETVQGILVNRKDIAKSKPFSLEYMESIGLKKADLKKLVSAGLAIRGLAKYNDGKHHDSYLLITDVENNSDINVSEK